MDTTIILAHYLMCDTKDLYVSECLERTKHCHTETSYVFFFYTPDESLLYFRMVRPSVRPSINTWLYWTNHLPD